MVNLTKFSILINFLNFNYAVDKLQTKSDLIIVVEFNAGTKESLDLTQYKDLVLTKW